MRILVTGATGLLGQELCPLLEQEGWKFWATNSKIFDITNTKMVNEIIKKVSLDFIIHLAAYTNIDQAEIYTKNAFDVNHIGTKNMAEIAKKFDVPIIYLSTDCVFDGKKTTPYRVDDPTNPINVYGESKLKGEEEIRKLCKKHYIVRTGWLYGKGGKSFVDTMLTFSSLRDEISVVDDQIGCPTWTKDVAREIVELIKGAKPYGTYHICSLGKASWSEFTSKIYEIKKRPTKVTSIEKSDFPRPAKRPRYCVLESSCAMPLWDESLEKYLLANNTSTSADIKSVLI
ncbi:dTDP-4-dehydrorhamnose reductase [Candidatus Gastranaerophilus sp. (ex Termes propinquus)]|nr:dTDP-4-dehydrorhamnose reductase [Candidatus Gastranaerophilus sp. (ex Termes propinquus)]